MNKKIKFTIYIASTLWLVFFAQIMITKLYVSKNNVTQAFARNQLAIQQQSTGSADICREGGWVMGKLAGKLTLEEKKEIAEDIFGYEGGGSQFDHEEDNFYVAYGFSNGINMSQKVNGKRINMNIAITYDENQDKSIVYFGVPILFDNF